MTKGVRNTCLLHSCNSVNQDSIPFEGHYGDGFLARLLDDSNSEYKLIADAKYTPKMPDKQQISRFSTVLVPWGQWMLTD